MAQGSIVWRCRTCGNQSSGHCAHPKASYSIVYYVGTRQKWMQVGRNRRDAERKLVAVLAGINNGTYRELLQITFAEFSGKWIQDYVISTVKPTTLRQYRGLITHHLIPEFGASPLTSITPDQVQRYMAASVRKGAVSPRTVNHSLVVLKQMLKHAKRWGYLRDNPAQEIRHVRVEHQEMDFLKPDEIRVLLRHADEPFRTLFLTAIMTGMRLGELLALQWGDIDWHNRVIRVRRSVFWYSKRELAEEGSVQAEMWKFTTPKSTRSCRAIAMSPHLKEALELHRLQCRVSPHDLVFCSQTGTPIQPRNLVRREFEPALVRAELRRIRFHDLRHTYTALLIAQGTHPKLIQSQLGHASIQTTLDRYGHLLPHMGERLGEVLDSQVFGADKGGIRRLSVDNPSAPESTLLQF